MFGVDDDTMESVVLQLLRERGCTLGLAESVTGGLVAGRITNVPGASEVFRGGVVSYASEVKFDLLGVPEGPVVSEAAAAAMAVGAQRRARAPTWRSRSPAWPDRPSRTACRWARCASASPSATEVHTRTLRLPGQRDQMRQMSVITALDLLRRRLLAVARLRHASVAQRREQRVSTPSVVGSSPTGGTAEDPAIDGDRHAVQAP